VVDIEQLYLLVRHEQSGISCKDKNSLRACLFRICRREFEKVPAAQCSYFRIFPANPRRSESVRTKDLYPDGQITGRPFTKLDTSGVKSGMQAIEIDLFSVLANGGDDVESHGQSAASFFQRNRWRGMPLHRLKK
jgi:hypothetical protein